MRRFPAAEPKTIRTSRAAQHVEYFHGKAPYICLNLINLASNEMFFWRKKLVRPDNECIDHGWKAYIRDEWSHLTGTISAESNETSWRYEMQPKRSPYSPLNLFEKPVFIVLDHSGNEVLRIQRRKRIPATFDMIERGEDIGTIQLRSIFRNKYLLKFNKGPTWTFRMPLFTILFWGESSENSHVWVLVGPGKSQWNVLMKQDAGDLQLLFALAFIHREWWTYS